MKSLPNILAISYWSYAEGLTQSAILPHLKIISRQLGDSKKIYLHTLEKKEHFLSKTERAEIRQDLASYNIVWKSFPYKKFGVWGLLVWMMLIPKLVSFVFIKGVSHIHCWCTPAGAIGYIVSLLTRKKLIIDSYEPHAESMVENGVWKKDSLAYKILFYLEKKQSIRADHLISATLGMKKYMQEKYQVQPHSFFVKPACVDLKLFSEKNKKNKKLVKSLGYEDKIVAVYAGKFGGIYLDHEFFDFLKVAHDYWGDVFRVLILTNHTQIEIDHFCDHSSLSKKIVTAQFVKHQDIPDYIGLADFAITPVKPIPTKKYCTPIKNGEYWALGLPVVITNDISDDTDIIRTNNIGAVMENFDRVGYHQAVEKIDVLLRKDQNLFNKIRDIASVYRNFSIAEKIYKEIYTEIEG